MSCVVKVVSEPKLTPENYSMFGFGIANGAGICLEEGAISSGGHRGPPLRNMYDFDLGVNCLFSAFVLGLDAARKLVNDIAAVFIDWVQIVGMALFHHEVVCLIGTAQTDEILSSLGVKGLTGGFK